MMETSWADGNNNGANLHQNLHMDSGSGGAAATHREEVD